MATLEEVVSTRRNNPLTLSLFFKGKSREMFTMLFGEPRWLEEKWSDLSRMSYFDFERVIPMPYEIKERREEMLALLQGEITQKEVDEFWHLYSKRDVPTTTAWTMAKWGVADTRDIHTRFRHINPEGKEPYLQLTFMGLINLPFALFSELDQIGIQYDALWINDIEKTFGNYSTPGNRDSYYGDFRALICDIEDAYRVIYDVSEVDHLGRKAGLLMVRDLFTGLDNNLKEFLVKRPTNEWEDNRARIFFAEDDTRREYCTIEKLIDGVLTRNDFLREEIWQAERAADKLSVKLFSRENKDVGYIYYNLRRLVDWGLEATEKQLAG